MNEAVRGHPSFLSGGGEMGEFIRTHRWEQSALGNPADWPQALKTAAGIMLSSGYAMYIAWGRSFTQLYNDAYRPILGSVKHPAALGSSTAETFSEIWDFIGPMFRGVLETGVASTYVDQLLLLERHGFPEECYFTFSYSAIPSDDGVGGVLVTCLETTQRVIAERRHQVLRQLLEKRTHEDVDAIVAGAVESLARDPGDMPFVVAFRRDARGVPDVIAHTGLAAAALARVADEAAPEVSLAAVGTLRAMDLAAPVDPSGAEVGSVGRAACIGVAAPGSAEPQVVLVIGLSPRLAFEEPYADFLRSVAANVGIKIAEAQAFEHERRRAAELAEIDRAKTVFFSDVSHEFRTPITLMMGPLDDAIAATSDDVRESLVIARRNASRLLKLVNSLLDFSRIEAGRMQARFEPVHLARLTTDLASNFRSAIERAGLAFDVDCPEQDRPVCVDASMWEKIVLNLLSNAFKHTFSGRIGVRLREADGVIRLEVRDTGIGIAPEQLPLIFERFRRVPNARSRTHEGSGIGLALVRELARMHGGDVHVDSREGEGSVFTVSIDARLAPTPGAAAGDGPLSSPGQTPGVAAYVDEAMRWLPDAPSMATQPASSAAPEGTRILVADDNADMRAYLGRLISQRWEVRTCNDGEAAFEMARTWRPDLVLSDVMMPKLDGFQLIRRLREDPATASVPVILLSARAGEDARIDGLRAGAEDYLVKPFTARDLYARVENQLMRSHARRQMQEAGERLQRLFAQAPVAIALLQGPEFTFAIANPPYCELVARSELVGKTVREALPELEGQGIFELLEQVRSTQEPVVAHSRHIRVNRHGRTDDGWFSFVYQPIVDATGATEAILVVVYEVTELALAKQSAEVANFTKDQFLAMLGHELRNPLAPIVTALQIMRLRHGDEMVREREIIERQVGHLMGLVDDLLDISRVTQGKLELRRRRLEMADVISAAVEQAEPLLEKRHHTIEVDVAAGLAVDGDEKRLSQVITNLLTNAAKFMGDGGVIRVIADAEGDEVVVRVIDEGIGIDADAIPKVFDTFFQARTTFDRGHGGLGLGLAIVRNLVALHGGTVSAHSEGRDRGSEFVVRLPRAAAHMPAPPSVGFAPEPQPAPGTMSILIVDDNEDAAETMAELLRLRGHRVTTAYDAASALHRAAGERWDAAFLDLGLPAMNGYELANALWAMPAHAKMPVYAVSGYGQSEDRRKTGEAGFAGHLVKPVTVDDLESAMQTHRAEQPPVNARP